MGSSPMNLEELYRFSSPGSCRRVMETFSPPQHQTEAKLIDGFILLWWEVAGSSHVELQLSKAKREGGPGHLKPSFN